MSIKGGCYCGNVRYESEGEAFMKAECLCRECQYLTGGGPNFFMAIPAAGFKITKGETQGFSRDDIDNPVTREFCPNCGTHLVTRTPSMPDAVILKVGSLDDPGVYDQPQMAIFTIDQQSFHTIAEGVPSYERVPG